MIERPKIKVELSIADKLVEIIGWVAIVSLWGYTLLNFHSLPDTIPTHFDFKGEANDYGSKSILLVLPILATVLLIGMTTLNNYPNVFNYPVPVTEENALRQYTIATRLIRYMKLSVVILFSLIVYKTVETVSHRADGLGLWFLPLTLAIVFGPMLFFIYQAYTKR